MWTSLNAVFLKKRERQYTNTNINKYVDATEEQKCLSNWVPSWPYRGYEREIANAVSHGQEAKVPSHAFKLKITCGGIQTLRSQQYLTDVVISLYTNLLVEINKEPGHPVLCFSTFFYPKLNSEGWEAVRRWTKTVDLFSIWYNLGIHSCQGTLGIGGCRHKEKAHQIFWLNGTQWIQDL